MDIQKKVALGSIVAVSMLVSLPVEAQSFLDNRITALLDQARGCG